MYLLNDRIIPREYEKSFNTNAYTETELQQVSEALRTIPAIKDIIIDDEKYPRAFTVHTREELNVEEIENKIKALGYQAIASEYFLI